MIRKTFLLTVVMALAIASLVAAGTETQQGAAISNAESGKAEGAPTLTEDVVSYYPSAYTEVVLDTSDSKNAIIKVAFSGDVSYPDSGSAKDSVSLTMKNDGSYTASNAVDGSEDELYAVWDIFYSGSLDISVGMNNPLKYNSNSITWKVTPDSGTGVESSSSENTLVTETIGTHDGSSSPSSTGNKKLFIETTESAQNKPAGAYKENLYILVSDQGA